MNDDIDEYVRKKVSWAQLPSNVKHMLGDSHKEYERYIFDFSIKNQLRYRGNLVRTIRRDERAYYEALVRSSIQRLMLFPYHLADMVVKGLRITPFIYYTEVLALIMELEKSYDTLPNFTAADCLRLLGIGRNEYLELVSKMRGGRRMSIRGSARGAHALLPKAPLPVPLQPWWRVELGYVLEDDVKPLSIEERAVIDQLVDYGSQTAGVLDAAIVRSLYRRGLIYLEVPITGADRVRVPPLKGFVMNRLTGDYFETLLYKVFVSIDEHSTIAELSAVLQVDSELVKQAVSLYCRLGFARKLDLPPVPNGHHSWMAEDFEHPGKLKRADTPLTLRLSTEPELMMEPVLITDEKSLQTPERETNRLVRCDSISNVSAVKRTAFLFDSSLTAYLMMGNLSPDLKSHAVTLFEVGKLTDESLDSLVLELDKVCLARELEGEARRYARAAAALRAALNRLRRSDRTRPLDMLRCESLLALSASSRKRLMASKYRLAISMAPLSREAKPSIAIGAVGGPPEIDSLPHFGPAPPEASTPWMRLFIYHVAGYGPPTLLLTKGTVLRCIPRTLLGFSRLWVTPWGADASESSVDFAASSLTAAQALSAANMALRRSSVLIQAASVRAEPRTERLAFPTTLQDDSNTAEERNEDITSAMWWHHAGLLRLARRLNLHRNCGYVTLVDIGIPDLGCAHTPRDVQLASKKNQPNAFAPSSQSFRTIAKSADKSNTPSNESIIMDDEDIPSEKRLQSPNESHFALTPVNDSIAHSPANGFTSLECNDLLNQELNQLESLNPTDQLHVENTLNEVNEQEVEPDHPSLSRNASLDLRLMSDSLLSPMEDTVSMFSQLSDKLADVSRIREDEKESGDDESSAKPEHWTVLDLQFGVPLFDEQLADQVSAAIVDRLAGDDSFHQLKRDNEDLSSDVLKFVSQCQFFSGEDMGIVKRGSLVPVPNKSLVFENGKISIWNGK